MKLLKQSLILCVAYTLATILLSLLLRPSFVFDSFGYVGLVDIRVINEKIPSILQKIASCESGNRQFGTGSGQKLSEVVLRGRENPADVGLYQINEFYHLETAEKLGINLYTWTGNTQYALYLYKKNGTRDWNWSRKCWGVYL